jgi:hypothetical protein
MKNGHGMFHHAGSSLSFFGRRKMKLADFEQKVWDVENIRIVVRADENDEVKDYNLKRAADETWVVTPVICEDM